MEQGKICMLYLFHVTLESSNLMDKKLAIAV